MSKTYILEPTEIEFSGNPVNSLLSASLENTQFYGLTADELKNLIPDGSIVDINNGDKFIAASDDRGIVATRDGTVPESPPEEYAGFIVDLDTRKVSYLSMFSNATTSPGKYTVSIYTETEDAPKYPVKNTSYELHGHNEVERIRYKLKKKAEHGGSSDGLSDLLDLIATNDESVTVAANVSAIIDLDNINEPETGTPFDVSLIGTCFVSGVWVSVSGLAVKSFGPPINGLSGYIEVINVTQDSIEIPEYGLGMAFCSSLKKTSDSDSEGSAK